MIVGAFGGAVLCDLYCEFDVPNDDYDDFVAAVDEAQAADAELAAYNADEASFRGVPPEDLATRRAEKAHGWNKAVAILEERAADEDRQQEEDKKNGDEAEAVVDTPDEQVDVVIEGDEANKG